MSQKHSVRRTLLAALAFPLALWGAIGSAQGATLEEIKKRGYMVVATEDDFRPFEFHGYLGNRRTVSFGWHYDFASSRVRPASDYVDLLAEQYAAAKARLCAS